MCSVPGLPEEEEEDGKLEEVAGRLTAIAKEIPFTAQEVPSTPTELQTDSPEGETETQSERRYVQTLNLSLCSWVCYFEEEEVGAASVPQRSHDTGSSAHCFL